MPGAGPAAVTGPTGREPTAPRGLPSGHPGPLFRGTPAARGQTPGAPPPPRHPPTREPDPCTATRDTDHRVVGGPERPPSRPMRRRPLDAPLPAGTVPIPAARAQAPRDRRAAVDRDGDRPAPWRCRLSGPAGHVRGDRCAAAAPRPTAPRAASPPVGRPLPIASGHGAQKKGPSSGTMARSKGRHHNVREDSDDRAEGQSASLSRPSQCRDYRQNLKIPLTAREKLGSHRAARATPGPGCRRRNLRLPAPSQCG